MKSFHRNFAWPLFFGFCLISPLAFAELRTFTVDQALSSLTIDGSFQGIDLQPQGPGSLTAHYTGTILADVTGSTITFVGGSALAAVDTGDWQPGTNGAAGIAPANYGGAASSPPPFIVVARAAFRSLLFDMTSGPLQITGGSFPADTMIFKFPTNAASALDYNYSGFLSGSGRRVLAGGESTNNVVIFEGIVTNRGSDLVLTFPAEFFRTADIITPNDLIYGFHGQIVAVSTVPLQVNSLEIAAGQLRFTINTVSNQAYSILGSTNLIDWPSTNDQFVATNSLTTRSISLPNLSRQFFRVRKD
jgi:hypothetical protein